MQVNRSAQFDQLCTTKNTKLIQGLLTFFIRFISTEDLQVTSIQVKAKESYILQNKYVDKSVNVYFDGFFKTGIEDRMSYSNIQIQD